MRKKGPLCLGRASTTRCCCSCRFLLAARAGGGPAALPASSPSHPLPAASAPRCCPPPPAAARRAPRVPPAAESPVSPRAPQVVSCAPEEPLLGVLERIVRERVHHAFVVDVAGRPLACVGMTDVLRLALLMPSAAAAASS